MLFFSLRHCVAGVDDGAREAIVSKLMNTRTSMQNLFVWVSIVSMLVFSGIVMFIIEGTWILLKCPGLGLTHSFFRLIIQDPCILWFDCLYLLVCKTL